MTTAPDALLEQLTRLDAMLGEALHAAVDDDTTRVLSDAATIAFTKVTESIGRRCDALRITAAREIDDRSRPELERERLSARNGCRNGVDLLARLTGTAAGTATARIELSRRVAGRTTLGGGQRPAEFPAIRTALADGRLGLDSATAITRTLGPIADRCDRAHLAAAEGELVAAATGTGPDSATPVCADETRLQAKVWRLLLDPDGPMPEHEKALRQRSFVFGRERDGVVPCHGGLLPDVAAQFQRLIDAHLNPHTPDHTENPGVVFREYPEYGPAPDNRTRSQKQHDVLASILNVAARSAESPSIGGAPPTLLVTISADDLQQHGGVGFVDGTDAVVPAFVARHIACCGGIQRLVVTDSGRVVQLSAPNRIFTAAQRRAISARDGVCVITGCHVPAEWCEVHHVQEHSRGGPTDVDNGVNLCWWHHRSLDFSGWEIRMVDGMPQVRAPGWIDPPRRWQPTRGSLHAQHDRQRRRLARM
ncbi:hypothetical protein GCM10022240_16840 [Microbacterium kribbense]|uniref:HNH nuclease domain-containing protein n=1 Tax=Microbacterium kribbense TaxID=433645 RepID=A0ABP7GIC7_9MICO